MSTTDHTAITTAAHAGELANRLLKIHDEAATFSDPWSEVGRAVWAALHPEPAPTDHTREALAALLSETLDWDWAPAPAEGVPSGRDECGQVADAILASPWLAAHVAAVVEGERARIRAAIRLVQPDHLTPVGARIIEQALGGGSDE